MAGIAVLTGLLPVLIHLINRRRYRRVPWAAMSFLLAANRRSVRRIRLEQWLLMLARISLIVLLGLALARPYVPTSPLLPLSSSRVHRVILLDNSLSMKAQISEGRTRFDAARECASRLLASFPPADAVSIVTLAEPAQRVIAHPAYDRRFVRDRVAAIQPTQRATDAVGAATAALEIVRDSDVPSANRAVYVISDFPRHLWRSELPQTPAPTVRAFRQLADALADPTTDLTLVRVDPGSSENLAVTRLGTESPLIGVGLPVRIAVEVTNLGSTSVRDATLQLRHDGRIVRREPLPRMEPGASTVAVVSTEFTTSGTHLIEAKVIASTMNTLEDDDTRYLSIEVRESTRVLLVDGRPGAKPLDGQAGFLATALAPRTAPSLDRRGGSGGRSIQAAAPIETKLISESELEGEGVATYDVLALCNVGRLSPPQWRQLERFTADGGGLLLFLGDLVSAENYNRMGYASGVGLLPGTIHRSVETRDDGANPLAFKLDRSPHPIVAEFGSHPMSGLFLARVDRYLPLQLAPNRAEVVLRYTNEDPAFVASSFGKGRVIVCTTTANMEWNNLPAKGDYVSLMLNTVAFLSPRRGDHRNLNVGQTLQEPLSPVQSALPLRVTTVAPGTGTDGATAEPSLVPYNEALALEYGPLERAGALTVAIGPETKSFAVNVDPAESDLRAVDDRTLTEAFPGRNQVVSDVEAAAQAPAAGRSTELGSFALYAVIALLFGELWLAVWFGSPRGVPVPRSFPPYQGGMKGG